MENANKTFSFLYVPTNALSVLHKQMPANLSETSFAPKLLVP